ncbi:hypothetical protein Ddye_000419 [Dipteronia dyeriana]|uniref:Uncharacterized protein n=1 Tax=Dipteronia dyeriana TaxID=168575 RepID=A0AAD9XLW2_9ROSI|nr:hypothetical protein Ddye_000419 [Dipteronia dyeriana]
MAGGGYLNREVVPFTAMAQIMEYPTELTVVFIYNICVSFLAAIVGSITERDSRAVWINH